MSMIQLRVWFRALGPSSAHVLRRARARTPVRAWASSPRSPVLPTRTGTASRSGEGVIPSSRFAGSGAGCSCFTPRSRSRAVSQSEIRCASTAAARISRGSFPSSLTHDPTYAVPCRGSWLTPSFSPVIIAAISARSSSLAYASDPKPPWSTSVGRFSRLGCPLACPSSCSAVCV